MKPDCEVSDVRTVLRSINVNGPEAGAHIFFFFLISQHLKFLGAGRVTCSKFRTEDPQVLGATIQSSVAQAACCPKFVPSLPEEVHCVPLATEPGISLTF